MKKFLTGIFAIALAVGSVAFTSPKAAKFTDYYFPTDINGTPQSTSTLYTSLQGGWGCNGSRDGCAKSFTSYIESPVGTFNSSGNLVNTYLKN